MKKEKETKFIQIKQGDKSVREYEAKFEEMSKLSSYLKHIPMMRNGRHVIFRGVLG